MGYQPDPVLARQELHARISNDFAPHPPRDDDARGTLNELCAIFEQVGHRAIDLCPEGRHLSLCLTNLEAAKRDAVAAIACHQDD